MEEGNAVGEKREYRWSRGQRENESRKKEDNWKGRVATFPLFLFPVHCFSFHLASPCFCLPTLIDTILGFHIWLSLYLSPLYISLYHMIYTITSHGVPP